MDVTLLHFNVGDYIHTPSLSELEQSVDLIIKTADKGKTTYVHCKAGRTRSATVCCAYLLKVIFTFVSAISLTVVSSDITIQWRKLLKSLN